MIFIDSNVPMYLVRASHPHKTDAQHLLERAIAERRVSPSKECPSPHTPDGLDHTKSSPAAARPAVAT